MEPEQWAYAVWKQLHELADNGGPRIEHIVFTTDETDSEWL